MNADRLQIVAVADDATGEEAEPSVSVTLHEEAVNPEGPGVLRGGQSHWIRRVAKLVIVAGIALQLASCASRSGPEPAGRKPYRYRSVPVAAIADAREARRSRQLNRWERSRRSCARALGPINFWTCVALLNQFYQARERESRETDS